MANRDKIIELWERAATSSPVVLSFPDKKQRERARFTLYAPFKSTTDARLLELREQCEVVADKKAGTLTIQRKKDNPFHANLESELEKALGSGQEERKGDTIPDFDADESLRRLQEKLQEGGQGEGRRNNPYFERD